MEKTEGMKGMRIREVRVSELKPAKYNPRTWTQEEMERLKESIVKFGAVLPAVVNSRTGNVVGGHMRAEAARQLEKPTMPCVFVDLPPKKERELNLRLNRGGEWDWKALAGLGVAKDDLAAIGFAQAELDMMGLDAPMKEDASGGAGGAAGTKWTIPLEFGAIEDEEEAREHFTGADAFERTANLIKHYAGD